MEQGRRKKSSQIPSIDGRVGCRPLLPLNRRRLAGLLAVLGLSLVLNSTALDWGRSGLVPWYPDSIEGITTVREMPRLFGQWTYKYPRGQFLINAGFYKPLIEYWKKHPVKIDAPDGKPVLRLLNLDRLDLLAKISRLIVLAMAMGTVLAVFLTARLLFNDYYVGLLGALTMGCTEHFVFHSHFGCVDIPYIFWFAWGLYFAVKAVYTGRWYHYLLLGLTCGYSVCTKESAGGFVAGIGLAVWIAAAEKEIKAGSSFKDAVLSVVSLKVILGAAAFIFLFALMNGFFAGPGEFVSRMQWWSGRVADEFEPAYKSQLSLLADTWNGLWLGMGWPLLLLCIFAFFYCAVKFPVKTAFCIFPFLTYHVMITMRIHFVAPRFVMAAYPGFAILAGRAAVDFLRWEKFRLAVRIAPVGAVYVLSLFYCVGLLAEMKADSRVRIEKWFLENAALDSSIGVVICRPEYSPRLISKGFANVNTHWNAGDISRTGYPDYIVVPQAWPRAVGKDEDVFRNKLFSGQLPYERVAGFGPKYLLKGRTIFDIAGWPRPEVFFLSPQFWIFKKTAGQSGER